MHAEAEARSAYSKSYPYIIHTTVDKLIDLRTRVLCASTRCVSVAILAVVLTQTRQTEKNKSTTNFAVEVARALNVGNSDQQQSYYTTIIIYYNSNNNDSTTSLRCTTKQFITRIKRRVRLTSRPVAGGNKKYGKLLCANFNNCCVMMILRLV